MWELDCEESWAPKNRCFWTVVLEKTLKSPLDCKEIQPVHPKGDQSWVFIGRTDAKAETPILWPPHAESWLIGKDSDAGRDWGQEEKGTTEDEMAGWHHQLDGSEFEWTLEVVDGQGGLACCDSWGREESDTTERLNWTELKVENTSLTFLWILGVFSPYVLILVLSQLFPECRLFLWKTSGTRVLSSPAVSHSICTMAQKNNFLKIEVQLIYSVILVSGVQHSDLIFL